MSLEMSFSELTTGRKVPEQGQIAGRGFRTSAPFLLCRIQIWRLHGMCGFVGFINGGDTQRDESVLHSMTDAIRHRGPDDADYYMDGSISLGFRRLSIIDLEGGRQPILNEDEAKCCCSTGRFIISRNQRDLLAAGHVFKTATDSEVLLHGYEEYGTDLLNKLRGMFAFVIWDRNSHELFGARTFWNQAPLLRKDGQHADVWLQRSRAFCTIPILKELNGRPGKLSLLPILAWL